MSGYSEQYPQQQQDYWVPDQNQYQGFEQGQIDTSYNFELPIQQDFGQDLDFQSFDPNAANVQQTGNIYGENPYLNPSNDGYYKQGAVAVGDGKFEDFEDEPPLLEELGINPDFILQKVGESITQCFSSNYAH